MNSKKDTHRSVAQVFDPAVEIGSFAHKPREVVWDRCVKVRPRPWGGQFLQKVCAKLS